MGHMMSLGLTRQIIDPYQAPKRRSGDLRVRFSRVHSSVSVIRVVEEARAEAAGREPCTERVGCGTRPGLECTWQSRYKWQAITEEDTANVPPLIYSAFSAFCPQTLGLVSRYCHNLPASPRFRLTAIIAPSVHGTRYSSAGCPSPVTSLATNANSRPVT
jgi:hypothetical protein